MSKSQKMIPDEIFEDIIYKLVKREGDYPRSQQADLAAARLVCKLWSKTVPKAVKTIVVEGEIPEGVFARNLSSLESLTWTYGIFSPSFTPPISLKVLKLRYAIPSGSLKHLALWFPTIESLELERIPFTCRGGYDLSPLASLTTLKSLSLDIGHLLGGPGDHPVRKIMGLEKLTNLTSLVLHEYYMIAIPQTVFQLTRLETLELEGYKFKANIDVMRAAQIF